MRCMEKLSEKELRQRKMLLFMPLLLIPMVTLAFYGTGGGKGASAAARMNTGRGLNMSLPPAQFDPRKKVLNKLGLYAQADRDSLRLQEARRKDPFLSRADTGRFSLSRDTSWLA